MYSLVRGIHGFSGVILLFYAVMYFVSGVLIVHSGRFAVEAPVPTTTREPIDYRGAPEASALVEYLGDALELRGRGEAVRLEDGGWRVEFIRPGRVTEVVVRGALDSATVIIAPRDWKARLVQLHRLHGYGGGFVYAAWALLYDLVSLAMIGFPLSGIYLWHRRTTDRRLGWVLLTTSCMFMIGVTIAVMTMR